MVVDSREILTMSRQRLLAWTLRLAAVGEFPAFATAVMPFGWMQATHAWLGLGALPAIPVVVYMARSLSLAYGLHAILMWIIATDVDRYRPLVVFHGWAFLALSPIFFVLDRSAGLPWFWTLIDAWPCLFFGVAVLWLLRGEPPGHNQAKFATHAV